MGIIASILWFCRKKKGNITTNGSDPAAGTAATPAPLAGWKKGTFDGVTYNYLYIKPATEDKAVFLLLHGFPNGTHLVCTHLLCTRVSLTLRRCFCDHVTHVASSTHLPIHLLTRRARVRLCCGYIKALRTTRTSFLN
jgi:hypothetical protein